MVGRKGNCTFVFVGALLLIFFIINIMCGRSVACVFIVHNMLGVTFGNERLRIGTSVTPPEDETGPSHRGSNEEGNTLPEKVEAGNGRTDRESSEVVEKVVQTDEKADEEELQDAEGDEQEGEKGRDGRRRGQGPSCMRKGTCDHVFIHPP